MAQRYIAQRITFGLNYYTHGYLQTCEPPRASVQNQFISAVSYYQRLVQQNFLNTASILDTAATAHITHNLSSSLTESETFHPWETQKVLLEPLRHASGPRSHGRIRSQHQIHDQSPYPMYHLHSRSSTKSRCYIYR